MDSTKNYLLVKDEGFVRKIVFLNKDSREDFRNLANVIPEVEQTGDTEKYRGYFATAPTLYLYVDSFYDKEWDREFIYQGSLYKKHFCQSTDIVVYCHEEKMEDFVEISASEKFISELMKSNN